MNLLTEAFIDQLAPNAGAMKNGRDLVKKNSFQVLRIAEDRTLLFGECKGSGKEPYRCSVDFIQQESPVSRCSCPSRQFPCKHALGLMYAFALGKPFEQAEIPADIAEKREKAEKREEKKKAESAEAREVAPPAKRKVNKSALLKKMNAQLEGLSLLEKLVLQTVHHGLGGIDKQTIRLFEDQAKQLGNYYIPGAQAELKELVLLLTEEDNKEAVYTRAMEQLIRLHALVRKGRSYLEERLADPDSPQDTETALEELLGHAWQLAELRELDRVKRDAELLQLSFLSYTDKARGEYVDAGWWVDLHDGTVHMTRHLRPFRAAKAMKEEDTVHAVVQAEELFIYPGDGNARVRWEKAKQREAADADYSAVKSLAADSYADVVKAVKNGIKNPLSDRNPVKVVAFTAIEKVVDGYTLRDSHGKHLPIASTIMKAPQRLEEILPLLPAEDLREQAVLVMFRHDVDTGRLEVQPMSIITERRLIRLLY
ncbi:SWIM zinc finger family protein [Paenibacillus paeoniae]|uniref:SWIM zinc finger family protein n=1 Tax=Paenibacillus paeoniae TaxID=2292705 RepID=A0A371PKL8_9BACL|nr:SWIM zinc finger family protein [Paenibacillus paeoniae]REK76754.1 SWIM zinc finger family protein [Paenibacillus paeoniae]